jgi:hypothetical protein
VRAGETAAVTFTFSEKVTGFDVSDVTTMNGSLGGLSSADGGGLGEAPTRPRQTQTSSRSSRSRQLTRTWLATLDRIHQPWLRPFDTKAPAISSVRWQDANRRSALSALERRRA